MAMAADFALNLGLPSSDIIVALILVQFVAFPTTLMWSKFAYKFGEKNTLLFTISLYLIVIAYSVFLSNAIAGIASFQSNLINYFSHPVSQPF